MINTIISKPKLTSEEKKKKIQELFEYHIPTLMKQPGLIEPIFIPKMAYKPAGKDEKHVTFFASEIEKAEYFENPKDIFIEFISNEYNPEDPKRTLYKWRFNPHWRTEYLDDQYFLVLKDKSIAYTYKKTVSENEQSKAPDISESVILDLVQMILKYS